MSKVVTLQIDSAQKDPINVLLERGVDSVNLRGRALYQNSAISTLSAT